MKTKQKDGIVRYTVTVKGNGDCFHSFSRKKAVHWAYHYQESCLNQDDPWSPEFVISEEKLN